VFAPFLLVLVLCHSFVQMREMRQNVAPKVHYVSNHKRMRDDLELTDIIVCSCVNTQLAELRHKTRTGWEHVRSLPLFSFNMRRLLYRLLQIPALASRVYPLPSGHMLFCVLEAHAAGCHCGQDFGGYWPDGLKVCLCGTCSPEDINSLPVLSLENLRPTLLFLRWWRRKRFFAAYGPSSDWAARTQRDRFDSLKRTFEEMVAAQGRSTVLLREKFLRVHSALTLLGSTINVDTSWCLVPDKYALRSKTAASRTLPVKCGCTGACVQLRCACAKAGRTCTELCHKKKIHTQCQRMAT